MIDNEKIYSVDEIRNLLFPIFSSNPVYKATLFGSYARGEADEGSDLDIVVDCDYKTMGLGYYGMWETIRETIGKRVDLIHIVDLRSDTQIYQNIQSEGVQIYEQA
jgi:predicted nucleotidyltransferase